MYGYQGWQETWNQFREECACDEVVPRWSFQGDTLVFQVQVLQAPPSDQAPQNLTGWFFRFLAKQNLSDQDNQAIATSQTDTVFPDVITFPYGASSGIIQVQSGPTHSIGLGTGIVRLHYTVKGIDTLGNVATVETGRWLLRPSPMFSTIPS
jgi:hypothetical protein